jgi:hypothetical protein
MRLRVLMIFLMALLAGCGGGGEEEFTAPTEKTEIIEETTEATAQAATRAPPGELGENAGDSRNAAESGTAA